MGRLLRGSLFGSQMEVSGSFFATHKEGWQFLVATGQQHRQHGHHSVIPLAWTGGHFDLLHFGEGGLPAGVVACLPRASEAPAASPK